MKILLVLIVFFSVMGISDEDENETVVARRSLFLYDLEKNDGVKAGPELQASRVYLKYSESALRWVFVLTDLSGQLPNPNHFLGGGTILQGTQLGADPQKRFRLNAKGLWEPTSDKVQVMTWKSVNPKRAEVQTFLYAPYRRAVVVPKKG